MNFPATIEPLENRIAPATLVKPNVVTFTDVDGDIVTVKINKGTFDPSLSEFTFEETSPGREQLQVLSLLSEKFAGTNVSITAKRSKDTGGDGFVNVGLIEARVGVDGITLGAVVIDGDLGALRVGEAEPGKLALKSLTAASLGVFGNATQGGAGVVTISVYGSIGKVTIKGDVYCGIQMSTSADAGVGPVKIGGSLIGGSSFQSGVIAALGNIGPVKIGGSIIGGGGSLSGAIFTNGMILGINLGGSLIGGGGALSGEISGGGGIGAIKIRGDIINSSGAGSGTIHTSNGSIKSLTVGGSVLGGSGDFSALEGQIFAEEDMGPVKIAGDVRGGAGTGTGLLVAESFTSVRIGGSLVGGSGFRSGGIFSPDGNIGPVIIAGSLEAGIGLSSGNITGFGIKSVKIGGGWLRIAGLESRIGANSGGIGSVTIGGDIVSVTASSAIMAPDDSFIGSISVGGDIRGGATDQPLFTAGVIQSITVKGSVIGTGVIPVRVTAADLIGKATIGGKVEHVIFNATSADGYIGPITIGGDFAASRIAAGTDDGVDDIPGTSDDLFLGGGDPAKLSTIAKLTIKGQAYGTVGGTDSFLIMAEKIGKITVGGTPIPGSDDPGDIPIGFTGDLAFRDRPVL